MNRRKVRSNNVALKSGNVASKGEVVSNIVVNVFLIVMCVFFLCSFLIVVGSSFQGQAEIIKDGYRLIPKVFSLDAYKMILSNPKQILDSYIITILVTVIGTLIGLIFTAAYGYVISRKDYPYRGVLTFFIFITLLFNGGMVAGYIINTQVLNLQDTIWALILPGMISPWNVMIAKSFFVMSDTHSLIEAAKIDGAGEIRTFAQIIVPISKPVLGALALMITLTYWNSWMPSLLYTNTPKLYTLQYMLMKVMSNMEFLNSAEALQYGLVTEGTEIPTLSARMAMCVVASGPILLVFPFFQKYFVKGLSLGGVKG